MSQQFKIIIFVIILFLASSVFLFAMNSKNMEDGQNWWAVYFASVKDQSLNFTIENHTNQTNFHWQIIADNNKLNEGDAVVQKDKVCGIL